MSAIKAVKGGVTSYWWGYSSQVNFKTTLTAGQYLISWMELTGIDVQYPKNYLNFYCYY